MQFEDIMKLVLGKSKQEGEGGEAEQQPGVSPEAKKKKVSLPGFNKTRWRRHLSADLHSEMNKLVKETHKHRSAYKKTLKVRDAQLWVALAQVSKRLSSIETQLGIQETSGAEEPEDQETETPEEHSETPIEEVQNQQMLTSGEVSSSAQLQAPLGQAE